MKHSGNAELGGDPCLAIRMHSELEGPKSVYCAAFQVTDLAKAEQALNDLGVEYHK